MGISYSVARFLAQSRNDSDFGSTLTLGRLELFLSKRALGHLRREFGIAHAVLEACRQRFADQFLTTVLGASDVQSMDFSQYEGASIAHDLNRPIPLALEQRFDTVIDGGTLEHVFNFPVALANCMKLLRPGGRLFLFTPGNSQMGHGFYQFSPELLYRALAPAQGFQVEHMEAVRFRYVSTELGTVGRRLEVVDPAQLGTRSVVASCHPLALHVCARKLHHLDDPFQSVPLQSDYVQVWKGGAGAQESRSSRLLLAAWSRLPSAVRWPLWNEFGRLYRNTPRNRRWFKPLR